MQLHFRYKSKYYKEVKRKYEPDCHRELAKGAQYPG